MVGLHPDPASWEAGKALQRRCHLCRAARRVLRRLNRAASTLKHAKWLPLLFATSLALVVAPAAAAQVLLWSPQQRLCIEGTSSIEVGVSYKTRSGGPRWFRIVIVGPQGVAVRRVRGVATSGWRFWRYGPRRTGTYRTTYTTARGSKTFRTRVIGCGD
jgi:hypothetical protein